MNIKTNDMTQLNKEFNFGQIVKDILKEIPNERSRDILIRRFGLGKRLQHETLESVGRSYNITRERVRQIENSALNMARKSKAYKKYAKAFKKLAEFIESMGDVVSQNEILNSMAKTEKQHNQLLFLLAVGDYFKYNKESKDFIQFWYLDDNKAKAVKDALKKLHEDLDKNSALSEDEIVELFKSALSDEKVLPKSKEERNVIMRWLSTYKKLTKNPLGEWGRVDSPHMRVKGLRDHAYLALKAHGSPLHYTEVADKIREMFGKDAHPATTHNELIKDDRFVLVGRGIYALREWGYTPGMVKDVIKDVLEKSGPLSKDEIVEKVKRERHVKDSTIKVNLQDKSLFKRLDDGRFTLV